MMTVSRYSSLVIRKDNRDQHWIVFTKDEGRRIEGEIKEGT
jgi:hypothetical protein